MLFIDTTAFIVAPHAIKVLQDAGYKLVTVADCLGQEPYLSTGPATDVRRSMPFVSANNMINVFLILFVGHMVLLDISPEHLHFPVHYLIHLLPSICPSPSFGAFLMSLGTITLI